MKDKLGYKSVQTGQSLVPVFIIVCHPGFIFGCWGGGVIWFSNSSSRLI